VPDARLTLIGAAAPRAERLADPSRGIEVTGYLDDLRPHLALAMFGVAPLRYGAGLQNKVIELMAAGLPSIVTPLVRDGIGATHGTELEVAEGPTAFAAAMIQLLQDPEGARRMGEAAQRYARERYRWDAATTRMAELLGG